MATTAYDVSKFQTPSMTSVVGQMQNTINQIAGISSANTAQSAAFAEDQRNWQQEQNQLAMEFNAREAAKNRQWQEYMSNTAHQREVKDLQAAGLNPVLSAGGGNGAAVTSGATASGVTSSGSKGEVDTSASAAIVSLLGTMLNAQNQLEISKNNALSNLAVADKYNAMSEIVAQINAGATLGAAGIHAGATRDAAAMSSAATRYAAQQSAAANRYSADQHYAASKYGADTSYKGTQYSSNSAKAASKYASDMSYETKFRFGNGEMSSLLGNLVENFGRSIGSGTGFGAKQYGGRR